LLKKTEIASVFCKFVIVGANCQLMGLKNSGFKLDLKPKLI